MENRAKSPQPVQFIQEVTEDLSILTRLAVANGTIRIREILDEERRQLSGAVIRALISLPIIIMATLFAGAAAIEWMANLFPLPLAAVYAVAAVCFALLAILILIWPRRLATK